MRVSEGELHVTKEERMQIEVEGFAHGEQIPERFAFGALTEDGPAPAGGNTSPAVRWSGAPEGTQSFVLVVYDPDVPQDTSKVGVEGETIGEHEPRRDFAHWLVADIPANVSEVPEGAGSSEITQGGKPVGETRFGGVAGANDYTGFMAGDPDMAGTYGHYDGPFPPPNDEAVHHYHFVVYALDIPSTGLSGEFGLDDLRRAIDGHVLAEAEYMGTYTLNPDRR
jgi:Raf kinase inhibitor-like YbhB/YbcL family protein